MQSHRHSSSLDSSNLLKSKQVEIFCYTYKRFSFILQKLKPVLIYFLHGCENLVAICMRYKCTAFKFLDYLAVYMPKDF